MSNTSTPEELERTTGRKGVVARIAVSIVKFLFCFVQLAARGLQAQYTAIITLRKCT